MARGLGGHKVDVAGSATGLAIRTGAATKVAIVTARFAPEGDLRGSDEVARDLFRGLGPGFERTLLASGSGESQVLPGAGTVLTFRDSTAAAFPRKAAHKAYGTLLAAAHRNPYASRLAETLRIGGTPPVTPSLGRHLRRSAYDVVCVSAFSYAITWIGAKAARARGIPLVFTPYYHYRLPKFRDSPLLRELVAWSSAVVACTDAERSALLALGALPDRTFVVPPGFDPRTIELREEERSGAKAALGLDGRFVVLAHPWVDKGILHVLPAVERLAARRPGVALLTIGAPDPDYAGARDEARRRTPGLEIRDLGWVPRIEKWRAFAACDVFAMPSLTDAFGFSYMSAWSLGKPIVAARGTSADSLVRDGQDGFLVEHDDADGIAAALDAVRADPGRGAAMGARGRDHVAQDFAPRTFIEGYERALRFAVSNRA